MITNCKTVQVLLSWKVPISILLGSSTSFRDDLRLQIYRYTCPPKHIRKWIFFMYSVDAMAASASWTLWFNSRIRKWNRQPRLCYLVWQEPFGLPAGHTWQLNQQEPFDVNRQSGWRIWVSNLSPLKISILSYWKTFSKNACEILLDSGDYLTQRYASYNANKIGTRME